MNLIKNVDGDWAQSKLRIRQDLDTIQRNINQILAQINAPEPAVEVPPATISSANTVTTYGTSPLTSVAVKPGSLITGNGRITTPLDMPGVNVAAAGALTGNGTSASPLSVSVDGSTITINGSNQLTGSSSPITIIDSGTYTVTHAQIIAGGDIANIVSAPVVTGTFILPLWIEAHGFYNVAYAAARDVLLRYSVTVGGGGGSAANNLATLSSAIRNATGDYRFAQPCTGSYLQTGFNTAANDNINKSLYLNVGAPNAGGSGAGPNPNYLTIRIFYAILTDI